MADMFGNILAINNAPARVRSRQANRQRRRELIHSRIAGAIGDTRCVRAAVQWSLDSRDASESTGMPIGSQHPGQAAIIAVQGALAEYDIPTEHKLRWIGSARTGGRGPHHMDAGVVTVELALRSLSGVDRTVDVPVMVQEGRVQAPVCLIDRGIIKTITQQTIDDIFDSGTFTASIPDRLTMFSPPSDIPRQAPVQVPLLRPGMFGFAPVNRQISAAYVRSAMRGQYVEALPDFQAMQHRAEEQDHLDIAERDQESLAAGDETSLKQALDVVARDGSRWSLSAGTKGQVQRDMDGHGQNFYVFFPELGWSAVIPRDALR